MKYAFLFALFPTLVQADAYCDELWFTRNLIFDRAGYCFSSELGMATFDNSDCTTKDPQLSQKEQSQVAFLKEHETWADCQIDTLRRFHDFDGADWLRQLITLPIRDKGESACIGYSGPPIPLSSGAAPARGLTGGIVEGDNVNYAHLPEEDWFYVTTSNGQAGWTDIDVISKNLCEAYAG